MRYDLLVIQSDGTPSDASVARALAADRDFNCHYLKWETVASGPFQTAPAHAVVAVAMPDGPHVTAFFQRPYGAWVAAPTLAVLPLNACSGLVDTVSRAADDFLFAPIRPGELRHRLNRILGVPRDDLEATRERLLEDLGMTQLVGTDPVFVRAVEQIPRMARSDMPVLITGETGTGKELCARAIHFLSKRRDFPFIAVDCGALPDHLLENELFGHARGAYTDAHRDQGGLVAMAEGGTLFLDEIDSLSLASQGKLLRFLQERTFRPLGAERFHRADVSVIAATNRDLESCVRDGQFRSDLYFRLNVLRLHLPSLRDRRDDIALLANHFLDERRATDDAAPRSFSTATLRALALYDWPGNVRELANLVQRASVLCDGAQILPCHVALPNGAVAEGAVGQFRAARAAAVEAFERRYVEDLLRKHQGNVTHAAREANKDRRAFGRLVKKYGIDRHAR